MHSSFRSCFKFQRQILRVITREQRRTLSGASGWGLWQGLGLLELLTSSTLHSLACVSFIWSMIGEARLSHGNTPFTLLTQSTKEDRKWLQVTGFQMLLHIGTTQRSFKNTNVHLLPHRHFGFIDLEDGLEMDIFKNLAYSEYSKRQYVQNKKLVQSKKHTKKRWGGGGREGDQ